MAVVSLASAVSDFPSLVELVEAVVTPVCRMAQKPLQTQRGICRTNCVWVRRGGKPTGESGLEKNNRNMLEAGAEHAHGDAFYVQSPCTGA